ncbi:MAG: hypothetical protein PHW75_03315 [Patescibacteria group bacterium]|nr:hypothetical protein [Patescibacteria group bacterium]
MEPNQEPQQPNNRQVPQQPDQPNPAQSQPVQPPQQTPPQQPMNAQPYNTGSDSGQSKLNFKIIGIIVAIVIGLALLGVGGWYGYQVIRNNGSNSSSGSDNQSNSHKDIEVLETIMTIRETNNKVDFNEQIYGVLRNNTNKTVKIDSGDLTFFDKEGTKIQDYKVDDVFTLPSYIAPGAKAIFKIFVITEDLIIQDYQKYKDGKFVGELAYSEIGKDGFGNSMEEIDCSEDFEFSAVIKKSEIMPKFNSYNIEIVAKKKASSPNVGQITVGLILYEEDGSLYKEFHYLFNDDNNLISFEKGETMTENFAIRPYALTEEKLAKMKKEFLCSYDVRSIK